MTDVAGLELSVLLAVARLADDAYGLSVRREVSERLDHEYSVGAIYTTLERLTEKGFLAARMAAPTPTRGGRARRHFRVTSAGARAMQAARHRASMQWMGVISPTAPEAT